MAVLLFSCNKKGINLYKKNNSEKPCIGYGNLFELFYSFFNVGISPKFWNECTTSHEIWMKPYVTWKATLSYSLLRVLLKK